MSVFHQILKEHWGYDSFRPLQEDIIRTVSEGKDCLGLLPTGGGKSICFQVPALHMEGICLVVTPLIALMKDQVDELKQRGIKALSVHSGLSRTEQIVALENAIFGNFKFLYISPERIHTQLFLDKLPSLPVSLLVVDEAHCISQWGYDFRPSYLRIAELRERLSQVPVLALTATATPQVVGDIQEKLQFAAPCVFQQSFFRNNLHYVVRATNDKLAELVHIVQRVSGTALVYVRSRRLTKELSAELNNQGVEADFYHAGLSADDKVQKQEAWKQGACRVMVCTNAFGMGIDKADVRLVVHYEMPASLEEYYQEAGRAGRDGLPAYVVVLYAKTDNKTLRKRLSDEFPKPELVQSVYENLSYYLQIPVGSGFQQTYDFSLQEFCFRFSLPRVQTHSALKILDLAAYIDYSDEVNSQSRLLFTVNRSDLYRLSLAPDMDLLLNTLLRSYEGLFTHYVYLQEDVLATRTGLSRNEVYQGLKLFSSVLRIVDYIPGKTTTFITYLTGRVETKHLHLPKAVYTERKERLQERVEWAIQYAANEQRCRSQVLLSYFGEKDSEPCGKCDYCLAALKNKQAQENWSSLLIQVQALLEQQEHTVKTLVAALAYPEQEVLAVLEYLLQEEKIKIDGNTVSRV